MGDSLKTWLSLFVSRFWNQKSTLTYHFTPNHNLFQNLAKCLSEKPLNRLSFFTESQLPATQDKNMSLFIDLVYNGDMTTDRNMCKAASQAESPVTLHFPRRLCAVAEPTNHKRRWFYYYSHFIVQSTFTSSYFRAKNLSISNLITYTNQLMPPKQLWPVVLRTQDLWGVSCGVGTRTLEINP